ncbi:MAG TPA: hypothetical protein VEW46_18355 [Pyrinomonadaceae bacterium]|nr:hypothetical protein [Pyrinomonadaceae bacterium]
MQSKKSVARKSTKYRATKTSLFLDGEGFSSNGKRYERPRHKSPETDEERKKRFAKREALTLRAFQIAYDNHHPRTSS